MKNKIKNRKAWWEGTIAYQIYPRSFKDSNGDGIGDLQGIISKLDYIRDLGIDLIWICPIYKSPNDDNGYDISGYQEVSEEFGTMEDFDELLKEVHLRGMKLIIDLVINHTSDEHPWFIESKSSKKSKKRDWYIWKENNKGEPNNWESIFGDSAWELDKPTNEYYLHLFSKKQPDLNWENKEVRKAIYKMISWWLDKGIDGFRVDAITHIKKDLSYESIDNPKKLKYVPSFEKHTNQNGIHEFLQELKEETFSKYNIVTVGEANGVKSSEKKDLQAWVGREEGAFNMIFQFEHLKLWNNCNYELDIRKYKKVLSEWQEKVNDIGWNALFIENHDLPRSISTMGDDGNFRIRSAKALAVSYFLQKGIPFIYQGQEIGMTNGDFLSIDELDNKPCILKYNKLKADGYDELSDEIDAVFRNSRDNSRTPMQWKNIENGGFTSGTPWIKVNENYRRINVEAQLKSEDSILNFYKKLIQLKKGSETLTYGDYKVQMPRCRKSIGYIRTLREEKYLIAVNLTKEYTNFISEVGVISNELVLSNVVVKKHGKTNDFKLRPYEARVYKIN